MKKNSKSDDATVMEVKDKFLSYMKGLKHIFFIMGTHNVYGTWLVISVIYPRKIDLESLKYKSIREFF